MTPQRILSLSLAWKSMVRTFMKNRDEDFDDLRKLYTGRQVHELLNAQADWLVNMAQIEEGCDGTHEAAKLTDAARMQEIQS